MTVFWKKLIRFHSLQRAQIHKALVLSKTKYIDLSNHYKLLQSWKKIKMNDLNNNSEYMIICTVHNIVSWIHRNFIVGKRSGTKYWSHIHLCNYCSTGLIYKLLLHKLQLRLKWSKSNLLFPELIYSYQYCPIKLMKVLEGQ